MSQSIRTQSIQRLCGSTSYNKGMTMYRTGKVGFTRYDDESGEYEAVVQSRRNEVEHVQIRVSEDEQIEATCSCPSLASYRYHCQHIAATLIYIHECEQRGEPPLLIAPTAALQGNSLKRNANAVELTGSTDSVADRVIDAESANGIAATQAHNTNSTTKASSATNASPLSEQDLYAKDEGLTDELLHLFTEQPRRAAVRRRYLETRDPLVLDVICHPLASGNGQYRIGIELRIGPTRTFIVRHIRRLLDSIRIGESYPLTSRFAYDPELHSFAAGDDRVLRQLIQIAEDELPADSAVARTQAGRRGERLLSVPVSHWTSLLAALRQCRSVYMAQPDGRELSIVWSQGPLPLQFQLDQPDSPSRKSGKMNPDEQHYVLRAQGLQPLIVLEAYEAVLNGAELVELDNELCRRLAGLQRLLDRTGTGAGEQQLHLSAAQLEPFVRQVVPELMKLGQVHLTRSVSDRIMQTPLQARLYLDRVRDRLLAGLEFQYGSLIINPLEPEQEGHDEDRIVLRDGEREAQILQLMDEADFTVTEGGYFLTDEEAEYTFLYHIVPRLEKLLHVYATSIVKAMLQNPLSPPKLTVQTDQRHDWLEIRFAIDGIPESEILHVLESLQEQRRYHRLPGGAFLPLEDRSFQQIADFIRRTGMAAPGTGVTEAEEGILFRLPVLYGLERLDMRDENEAIPLWIAPYAAYWKVWSSRDGSMNPCLLHWNRCCAIISMKAINGCARWLVMALVVFLPMIWGWARRCKALLLSLPCRMSFGAVDARCW